MRILLLLLLAAPLHAADAEKFAWDDRPRFRPSEYAVTGVSLVTAAAEYFVVPAPKTALWKGPILFDGPARNAILVGSSAGRDRAKSVSDYLAFPLIGYAMLDGPVTARWAGGNKDTALQLSLINAETFAVTEAVNLAVSNALPRSRPAGAVCDPGSKYDPNCVKSFWSGHTANVFAAASLVCLEHGELALYGGAADAVACGASLTIASGVGLARIAGNDHHASDVIVGAAFGAATGYLMPKLLHFRKKGAANTLGYLIPTVGAGGGGLTYVKAW